MTRTKRTYDTWDEYFASEEYLEECRKFRERTNPKIYMDNILKDESSKLSRWLFSTQREEIQ